MKTYSPRELGALINRTTQTLQRWDREGILVACRTPTNRRYYTHEQYLHIVGQAGREQKIITYCRVSSAGQKKDLTSQREAVTAFCVARGKAVDLQMEDIGSGLNYERKNFLSLMEMVERGEVGEIIIAHKDRLVRFGFEWFARFCRNHSTKLTIINVSTLAPEAEMTQDLLSIVHVFSSRLYGLRKYKKKLKEMILEQDANS